MREDEFTYLFRLDSGQGHLATEEYLILCVHAQTCGMLYVREVGVLQLTYLSLTFVDGAQIEGFGLHTQVTYRYCVRINRFSLLRNNLTFNIHTLRSLGGIRRDGDSLLETTRTTAAVLERSESIYRQAVDHYNQTLRKPWVYPPAALMGFRIIQNGGEDS